MKNLAALVTCATLLTSSLAGADEVVTAQEDRIVGGGFGGLSGFMLGAAAGGPIGALVGGGLGYFAGQGVQTAAGLEQTLYVIEAEDGSRSRVRTSHNGMVAGQQVQRDGASLTARNQ
jgi:outer membrane lipoprotein SlyB